jgi:purine-binding chemotaxis protein CheW
VTVGVGMLFFRIHGELCALPLDQVVETLRPLAVGSVPGMPDFVLGVSIIRGVPTPVVSGPRLLGAPDSGSGRWVVVRAGRGTAAVGVDAVLGVRTLDPVVVGDVPPLLRESDLVARLGRLDQELLAVLETARLVPETAWDAIEARKEPS